eukprot:13561-Heterococcus_DN1.PRE.2
MGQGKLAKVCMADNAAPCARSDAMQAAFVQCLPSVHAQHKVLLLSLLSCAGAIVVAIALVLQVAARAIDALE